MLFSSWLRALRPTSAPAGRQNRRVTPPRRGLRLTVEQLEDRLVPSNYTAANVSQLIADINAANLAGGSNTITLRAGRTFTLTAVDNTTDGATGLPVIAATDNLTIVGNGDTIARSTAKGTPAFRVFDVAAGASLTLANLALQGGLAFGSGNYAEGGAIYNQGALDLNGVTVQNNISQGEAYGINGAANGGGIWSSGSLTLEGGTKVDHNMALGGQGGQACGGGLYVAGGTVTLANVTVSSNTAQGGQAILIRSRFAPPIFLGGGDGLGGGLYVAAGALTLTGTALSANAALGGQGLAGRGCGNGLGGGLYAAGGTMTLLDDTVSGNAANGGTSQGVTGLGEGGGLYINAATVYLDAFTVANVLNNTASTSDPNIHGSYTLMP